LLSFSIRANKISSKLYAIHIAFQITSAPNILPYDVTFHWTI
jgi:hypothetical protein